MDKAIYTVEHLRLSRLLRELRTRAGLRQIDVAQRLDEPQSFVSKYESGERRLDVIELRQVAAALGLSLSEVIDILEDRLTTTEESFDERAALRTTEPAGPDAAAIRPRHPPDPPVIDRS